MSPYRKGRFLGMSQKSTGPGLQCETGAFFMARDHSPKSDQLFYLAYTCLNNMLYNKRIESEHRGRTVLPSAGRPHDKKVGERIHGACKRRPHARLIFTRPLRNRRLWLECLRLRRFPHHVQTTLLADSAPHDDQLWRLALPVVLGPCGKPQLHRLCRTHRSGLSGAARYRRRIFGFRPQQRRLWRHLWWSPPDPRPRRRAFLRR